MHVPVQCVAAGTEQEPRTHLLASKALTDNTGVLVDPNLGIGRHGASATGLGRSLNEHASRGERHGHCPFVILWAMVGPVFKDGQVKSLSAEEAKNKKGVRIIIKKCN